MRRPARSAKRGTDRPAHVGATGRLVTSSGSSGGRADARVATLLQAAVSSHQAGDAAEAERLYRQVLALDPEQPDALHLLGVLAYQLGRADLAVPLIEQAVTKRRSSPAFRLNLGNALLAAGRVDDAVTSYRAAVKLAPNDAEAHYNLGNALLQRGDADDGMAALRRAVRLRPDHLGAQYNLGNALRAAGRLDEAAAAYKAVVRASPDLTDAQTNLGTVLHELGRHDEARACFEQVLAARPNDPAALLNLAEALREQGQLDEAAARYERVLTLAPADATALRGLASIWQTRRRSTEAAALLGRLAAVRPDDAVVHEQYVRELIASGQCERALVATVAGLERCPGDRPLIRSLVDLLQTGVITDAEPTIRAALLAACTDDTFDAQRLATPIARIVTAAPEYEALLAAVRAGADPFATGVPLPEALVSEPAVLAALPRVVICAPDVERVLTALRRFTLLRATEEPPHPPTPSPARGRGGAEVREPLSLARGGPWVRGRGPMGPRVGSPVDSPEGCPKGWGEGLLLPRPFLCALAGAAFLVEHTWLIGADEAERLQSVRAALEALLADPASDPAEAEDLLILAALYDRLGCLPGAERLLAVPEDRWSAPFLAVLREQVQEPTQERALAASLPTLTPIDDAISQAVQAMYEENPYPRWRAARFHGPAPLADRYRLLCPERPAPVWPSPLPVLVAGAGTGQHPIQTALRLPEADVLAVDLSRASLAYGARMAARLGIQNLRFAQADILALDVLGQRFALVECGGVLHHLADPLAGWAVLRRLLRSDGLMLIALYSERARAGIVAARELIATEAFPSTPEGIRAARRHILDLPSEHPAASLTHFWDFYSESGFRDLAMHVQEHRFTIPRLAASLDALELRFLGFEVSPETRAQFQSRFPSTGAWLDLECWDAFEADQPDTFASMYQLWCTPR